MAKKPAGGTSKVSLSATAKKLLERQLKQLSSDRQALTEELGGDDAVHALVWAAVEGRVRHVGDWPLRAVLLERDMRAEGAAILAKHLSMPQPEDDRDAAYLPGWTPAVDTLVARAVDVAPEAFVAAEASYEPWASLGLAFVRWRRGEPIPAAQAERIATELGRGAARGKIVEHAPDDGMRVIAPDGAESRFDLRRLADVRALAAAIAPAGEARFDAALAETARENVWCSIAAVAPALLAMPRDALLAQLAARKCAAQEESAHVAWYAGGQALALFDARLAAGTDSPSVLFAIARDVMVSGALHDENGDARVLAAVLALAAAQRASGAVPDDFEVAVSFARVIPVPALLRALLGILRALPASRVLDWVASASEHDAAAVLGLAAHEDDTLLETILRGSAPLVVPALNVLGARALPTLVKTMNTLGAEQAARARHAFVFALAAATPDGQAPPEDLDLEVLVAAFDGRPMERMPYAAELRATTERLLSAMPRERRETILTAAYGTAPMSVMSMLHSIGDDAELLGYLGTAVIDGMVTDWVLRQLGRRALPALRAFGGQSKRGAWVREQAETALSAEDFATIAGAFEAGEKWRAVQRDIAAVNTHAPGAPRTRVYLLEAASWSTPARDGSISRLGGHAPGLPGWKVPKDDGGAYYRHVLTVDLDDAPELRPRYPGARAIALFAPSSEEGIDGEGAEIVPIPVDETKATPGKGGEALAVFGIDVPIAVFDDPTMLDVPIRAVRDRLLDAGGHVLGRPFWIHSKRSPTDGERFVMQIHQKLVDDLNLGDGALYVYDGDVIVEVL